MPQDQPPFEITEDSPTPIVRDFDVFLDAVGQPSAFLTKARQTLDRATLYALNAQVRTFQSDAHPRMDQQYYPLLNLFQRICLGGRLHVLGQDKGKLRMVPTDALAAFRGLCPAEKYLALLEALWVDCNWEDVLERAFFFNAVALGRFLDVFGAMTAGQEVDARKASHWRHFQQAFGMPEVIRIFSFFGFLSFTPGPPAFAAFKGQFSVQCLTLSALGKAFLAVLQTERPFELWNVHIRDLWSYEPPEEPEETVESPEDAETEPEPFCEAFLPLLPAGAVAAGLPRPERELRDQTFIFRVSYGKSWRTIALSSEHTLDDLHLAIQRAYRFDNDHLYAFYMDGKRHSRHAYNDPRGGDEGPFADEAAIGLLDLFVHQRVLYYFDFGDSWEFDVELLEVRDVPHKGAPKILQKEGKSPQQYQTGW